MVKLIFISLAAILVFGCGADSAEIDKLQKSNDVLQQKNDSLIPVMNEVNEELKNLRSGTDSPGSEYLPDMYRSPASSEYINVEEDAKNESDKNFKKSMDKLKTPRNTIPFDQSGH